MGVKSNKAQSLSHELVKQRDDYYSGSVRRRMYDTCFKYTVCIDVQTILVFFSISIVMLMFDRLGGTRDALETACMDGLSRAVCLLSRKTRNWSSSRIWHLAASTISSTYHRKS